MASDGAAGAARMVGRVVKPHGVRGAVVVDCRTDLPEVRFAVGAVLAAQLRDGSRRDLTVAATRDHGGRLLARFDGWTDRDAADRLRGAVLLADPADLPPTDDPDEFYDHEIEGLSVLTVAGRHLGTLAEIRHGGGGDLLVVRRDDGGEVLVPFVRQIVPEVDVPGGRILVDPPDGLLDGD